MTGINVTRRRNAQKIITFAKEKYGIDRSEYAQKAGINYNLLNQLLSENVNKNIGNNSAKKIMSVFSMHGEWLDKVRNDHEIALLFDTTFGAVKIHTENNNLTKDILEAPYSIDTSSFTMIPIMKSIEICRGKDLKILERDVVETAIEVPVNLIDPLAFEVKGSGFNKPYKHGNIILCDAQIAPQNGDEIVLIRNDGSVVIGEFLFEKNLVMEIDSILGTREIIEHHEIKQVYTIISFISHHLKKHYKAV